MVKIIGLIKEAFLYRGVKKATSFFKKRKRIVFYWGRNNGTINA
jgi:hypothetical protein